MNIQTGKPLAILILCSLFLLFLLPATAFTAEVTLSWQRPDDSRVTGYKIYYGPSGTNFKSRADHSIDSARQTSCPISGLEEGVTYNFAATSRDADGNESDFSETIQYRVEPQTEHPDDIDDDGDGYTENQGDCNDNDASIYPGAEDICGDGIDQDCNGSDVECPPEDGDDERTKYKLTVINGEGDGRYLPGEEVAIAAEVPAAHTFEKWKGQTAAVDDIYQARTFLTMPSTDVSLAAEFAPTEDSGSDDNSNLDDNNDSNNDEGHDGGNADTDQDGDGVPDQIEQSAPHDGDGNQDGVPDYTQNHVVSLLDAVGREFVTMEAQPGTTIENCRAIRSLPDAGTMPVDSAAKWGYFDFTICNIDDGGLTWLTIHLPENAQPTAYMNYGPTPDNPHDHWYPFRYDGITGAEINGSSITLYFSDAERGDSPLTEDRKVIDAGGPVTQATAGDGADDPNAGDDADDEFDEGAGGGCFVNTLSP